LPDQEKRRNTKCASAIRPPQITLLFSNKFQNNPADFKKFRHSRPFLLLFFSVYKFHIIILSLSVNVNDILIIKIQKPCFGSMPPQGSVLGLLQYLKFK